MPSHHDIPQLHEPENILPQNDVVNVCVFFKELVSTMPYHIPGGYPADRSLLLPNFPVSS